MDKKYTIALLFGGKSPEHEVSRNSAAFIADQLVMSKSYNLILIGINKRGEWYYFPGSTDEMRDGSWEKNPGLEAAVLTADCKDKALIFPESKRKALAIDCVFPVLHGANGEDGRLQGMLEMSGIPFVGCGMISSVLAMDKAYSYQLFDNCHLPQTPWLCLKLSDYEKDLKACLAKISERLSYPVFVKPANTGSSIGISKVREQGQLQEAIDLAFQYDEKVIVEREVIGREVSIAALGRADDLFLSVIGEIVPADEFYDYQAKYESSLTKLLIPAQLAEEEIKAIEKYAALTFNLLDCYGMARIDFFLSATGEVLLNEVNTIPGFVKNSMYPKLMKASGYEAKDLLDQLIDLALKREQKN